jgi:hypothetical protein
VAKVKLERTGAKRRERNQAKRVRERTIREVAESVKSWRNTA